MLFSATSILTSVEEPSISGAMLNNPCPYLFWYLDDCPAYNLLDGYKGLRQNNISIYESGWIL